MQGPLKDQDGFEPVSPKKQISQRRRTAEALAEAEFRRTTVYSIPKSPNSFGPLDEHDTIGVDNSNNHTSSSEPADVNNTSSNELTVTSEHADENNHETGEGLEDIREEEEWAESSHEKR